MTASARTLLDRLPVARSLARKERRRLERLLTVQRLEPGAVLFAQHDPPTGLALLLDGALVVTTRTGDGIDLPLGRVLPGEVIGEMGVVDGAHRSATVSCEQAATLLFLDATRFAQLEADADPILVWLLTTAARGMARRISLMSERIASAAVDPMKLHALPGASPKRPQSFRAWLAGMRSKP